MHRLLAALLIPMLALLAAPSAMAVNSPGPAAPTHLTQMARGTNVLAGGWIGASVAQLGIQVTGTGTPLQAQVEVRTVAHGFTGQPTAEGSSQTVSGGQAARLWVDVSGLRNTVSYIWQARVMGSHGNASAWVPFTTGNAPAFRIDTSPPSIPHITSPTNPKWGAWSREANPVFHWASIDSGSGVAGYSYSFGHTVHAPRPELGHGTTAVMTNAGDGRWVLHVWARDNAGNWSGLGFYRFNIDRTAPKVEFAKVAGGTFNPYVSKKTWTFVLGARAHVEVAVDRSGARSAKSNAAATVQRSGNYWTVLKSNLGELRKGVHTFVWDGKGEKGHIVPKGWYWIRVITTDALGNQGVFASHGLTVAPLKLIYPYYPRAGRHIVISLTTEAIYAYDGSTLVKWSLATTGNPALPTPTGHFEIFARFHPFEFISPWPPGSPYYYPPSWTNYAMEFLSSGYFIHDAPWRSVYGPGSDGPGQPGTNYGGTHGCVNVPFDMAQWLFTWAPNGTPVDILP